MAIQRFIVNSLSINKIIRSKRVSLLLIFCGDVELHEGCHSCRAATYKKLPIA